MDTKTFGTKQGAATTADLSQQEPHEEDAELKSSAASSDEERLAAGISMTGLQTKRLSGAQRKRLTRQRLRVLQVNLHHSRAALAALCAVKLNKEQLVLQTCHSKNPMRRMQN